MDEAATKSMTRPTSRTPQDGQTTGRQVERLPGAHLNLMIGGPLVLHFPSLGLKFGGQVVGFEPFAYIIVQVRIPQDVLTHIAVSPYLVAQHTASGGVYGFRTEVLNRVSAPAPLLFLAYPDSVDRIALRRNTRVGVSLLASVQGIYGEHPAMIQDLTPSGCKLAAKIDLKSPLRAAQVDDRLVLNCQLGADEAFLAPILLRRRAAEKGLLQVGAQFVDMPPEATAMVAAYINRLLKFMGR